MQTDTRTKVRFSHIIIYLIEPFEDTLYLFPVESDAVIRHSYFKVLLQRIAPGGITSGRKYNRNLSLLRCVLKGIGDPGLQVVPR